MTHFDLGAFKPPLALPALECGPVLLRPFDDGDTALVRRASDDPYIPSITSMTAHSTDREALDFIARQHERAKGGDGYPLVIARCDDPTHGLGAIGLWLRDIESGRASIGYWVADGARGKGAAAWAVRAMVAFAFEDLAIPRLQLFIEPWNVASVRTAQSAGFTFEASLHGWERIDESQHDADCYSLLRQDWSVS